MGPGFSPLDHELRLLPGSLTPRLHEHLVRLGSWMPFAQAALLAGLTGTSVSESTVRRHTEAAGAAYEAAQDADTERLEREAPPAPEGPPVHLMSVDGAMVPLVGG